jgi:hypothetical protein
MSDEPAEQEAEAEAPAKPRKKKRREKPTIEMPAAEREHDDASTEEGSEREPQDDEPRAADAPAGISSKTKIIAALGLGALVVGGIYLVQAASAPKGWAVGSEVDVELTLVAGDAKNLQCASKTTVGALHCAFEDGTKEWAKDDKPVLMPFTTTDKKNLLGAGLWTDAGMANAKLPDTRFSVKCKFKVEGKVPKPQVRWNATAKWDDTQGDWAAGTLHSCSLVGGAAPAGSAAPPAPKPAGS